MTLSWKNCARRESTSLGEPSQSIGKRCELLRQYSVGGRSRRRLGQARPPDAPSVVLYCDVFCGELGPRKARKRMRGLQRSCPRPASSTSGHRRAIMPLRVSGKNIKVGEALRGRINARLAEAMAKYFDGGFSGHVTIGRDGFGFRTECVVHLDSGIVLEAEALAADAYASADQAAIRIETRLRRYKRRRKDHQGARDDGRMRDRDAHERDQVDAPGPTVAVPTSDEQEPAESNP